jgi:hypothetical protein
MWSSFVTSYSSLEFPSGQMIEDHIFVGLMYMQMSQALPQSDRSGVQTRRQLPAHTSHFDIC